MHFIHCFFLVHLLYWPRANCCLRVYNHGLERTRRTLKQLTVTVRVIYFREAIPTYEIVH
jgi:hypothetical protein